MQVLVELVSVCSGGNHATVQFTFDGGNVRTAMFEADNLRAPLDAEDRRKLAELVIRGAVTGLTPAQARNKLQAGFTVTL